MKIKHKKTTKHILLLIIFIAIIAIAENSYATNKPYLIGGCFAIKNSEIIPLSKGHKNYILVSSGKEKVMACTTIKRKVGK